MKIGARDAVNNENKHFCCVRLLHCWVAAWDVGDIWKKFFLSGYGRATDRPVFEDIVGMKQPKILKSVFFKVAGKTVSWRLLRSGTTRERHPGISETTWRYRACRLVGKEDGWWRDQWAGQAWCLSWCEFWIFFGHTLSAGNTSSGSVFSTWQ